MICHLCHQDKLSKEFPFDPLTENCDHPLLHCLRCATASVKNNKKCSQCGMEVHEDNEIYKDYLDTLEFLFPNIDEDENVELLPCVSHPAAKNSHIVVTTLSGDCTTIIYNPNKTILSLKKDIEKGLKTPSDKQRLLYQNTELKATNENHELAKLKDYNVPPNSTLHLIILLYAVPEELDHVIFDLHWGFPASMTTRRKAFLDASVFLYNGSECLDVVDFRHTTSQHCPNAVRHSGRAKLDRQNRVGHHRITVFIKSIPDQIDKLIFTLSAWNSANLSKYPKPSLQFFDAKFPDKQLCSDEMSHAAPCQAIVMCSLSKEDGVWRAISLKSRASGCGKNYSPLKTKIGSLIRNRYI